MELPLIISFYTKNTIYEKEVAELIESCQMLQLDFVIEEKEDLGHWQSNCRAKPLFIYESLKKYQRPLFWVDADAIILKKPNCFMDSDVGFYFNNWEERNARAGTIFSLPTKRALSFFLLWHEKCQKMPDSPHGDQHFLPEVFQETSSDLRIENLPVSYVQVFDRDPTPLSETHILHTQASRTARMEGLLWKHLSGRDLKRARMLEAHFRASHCREFFDDVSF